jgi:hypothetical protein
MHSLPEFQTNHLFFRKIKPEMSQKALHYKNQMDNYSNLDKKEKFSVFRELLDLNFSWPDPLRQEGFWCDPEQKDFLFKENPYPKENQMSQDEIVDFLNKLEKIEKNTPTFKYLGYSHCRICGESNGTQTYYTDLFAWPQGFKHYIKEHGVMPSAAFVLHIRGLIK